MTTAGLRLWLAVALVAECTWLGLLAWMAWR